MRLLSEVSTSQIGIANVIQLVLLVVILPVIGWIVVKVISLSVVTSVTQTRVEEIQKDITEIKALVKK